MAISLVLLLPYSISTCALESPSLLSSCSIITNNKCISIAQHHHPNNNPSNPKSTPKSTDTGTRLIAQRSFAVAMHPSMSLSM